MAFSAHQQSKVIKMLGPFCVFCQHRSKTARKLRQNHGYTINVRLHFSPLWPTELPHNGWPYMLNANMYGLCQTILTATAHGKKYVNRRLECKFGPLLLPTSSHPRTHLCTGPNQTLWRYSQRKALDYVWQLGLISERILIFATFLYERAFIGIAMTNGLKRGPYKPELKNVRANAILMYGVVLTTCAKEKYWICTVPS